MGGSYAQKGRSHGNKAEHGIDYHLARNMVHHHLGENDFFNSDRISLMGND